ncbi:cyclodeaminase/cyclohydrolase family protein [Cohnella sp. AR92]|uniref:cyclodeaminase/cyclohydrolase family protein n=1 Tax=Cohnella sp. AR92 TaxID=648716 RepID=UPI000F8EE859|nr:cyclodeaminase/cyclohydrolase family protein [Cohnella sp. AR92]RUS42439.1 methenyltetrahydrofolate cyclohydrolase [Cohnella sp. AR92]
MSSSVSWDHSLREFLQQAGSSSPTPGGGSVAAVAAALGASMTSMVGNLSQGEKFALIQPQIDEAVFKMNSLIARCEELLQADIASFNRYMDALKLPKGTDEEKFARRGALHEATIQAIEVPLRIVELCRDGLVCTHGIAASCNKNVISDLGIGAILFEAAAQSALLTVEINLASFKDAELKLHYEHKLRELIDEVGELKGKALQITRERIWS